MLVFLNPHRLRAAKFDRWNGSNYARHHDRYAYEVKGRVFTHPTLPGAIMMASDPDRHAYAMQGLKPNFKWNEFCSFCGGQND